MSFCLTMRRSRRRTDLGFTLVEMLVSMVILLLIMVVIASMTSMASKTWRNAASSTSSFQGARAAFEALTQTLSQATLNSYCDYVDNSGNPRMPSTASTFVPAGYKRASELHFVSGLAANLVPGGSRTKTPGDAVFFQAVLGRSSSATYLPLDSSLNVVGFYVQYSDDATDWPSFVSSNFGAKGNAHFRLMEWVQQTQNVQVFNSTSEPFYNTTWFTNYVPAVGSPGGESQDATRILAENVTLLVILPKLSPGDEMALAGSSPGTLLCPNYQYDSRAWCPGFSVPGSWQPIGTHQLVDLMRNQLPPLVDVVMVAVSDKDIVHLQAKYGSDSGLPPVELQVPEGLFQSSANLSSDIHTYETQLTNNHITFKTFWSTVLINGGKWSSN